MSPLEQVMVVLCEAKREGVPWERAWLNAMRAFSPPRTGLGPFIRRDLETDRALLHENKPWLRAAYEDRDVTADEFLRASEECEKRLDSLMAA